MSRYLLSLFIVLILAFPAAAADSSALLGVVVFVDGSPLPGVTVSVQSVKLDSTRIDVTEADGKFRFEALPAGQYTVEAVLDGFGPKAQPVMLPVDETVEMEIVLTVNPIESGITVHN